MVVSRRFVRLALLDIKNLFDDLFVVRHELRKIQYDFAKELFDTQTRAWGSKERKKELKKRKKILTGTNTELKDLISMVQFQGFDPVMDQDTLPAPVEPAVPAAPAVASVGPPTAAKSRLLALVDPKYSCYISANINQIL